MSSARPSGLAAATHISDPSLSAKGLLVGLLEAAEVSAAEVAATSVAAEVAAVVEPRVGRV